MLVNCFRNSEYGQHVCNVQEQRHFRKMNALRGDVSIIIMFLADVLPGQSLLPNPKTYWKGSL